jgi:LmbE family N-acetylglucosaminyl deacetylase/glycosyltransferase involved in cell wall biosynthesis
MSIANKIESGNYFHLLSHTERPPVAAVIPAYNEAGQIGDLINVLKKISYITEIIVVDDGSTDSTCEMAAAAASDDTRVKVLQHPLNFGKGQALKSGWEYTEAPYVLFLDADLKNLCPYHIDQLVFPVMQGEVEMTVGLFKNGRLLTDLSHRAIPWLSGQRCIKSRLLREVPLEASQGYGIETAIATTARKNGWRYQDVWLKGVSNHTGNFFKNFWAKINRLVRIFRDIGRALHLTGGWHLLAPRIRIEVRLFLIILLILLGSSLAYNRSRAASGLLLGDIPPLDLTDIRSMLVVSPHPDDEVLGVGGLIQAAAAQGIDVRVLMLTNGDGQIYTPITLDRRLRSGINNHVTYGERRQKETIAAVAELGLTEDSVYFLGYPDRGLLSLWKGNWNFDCPVRSIFTRAVNNPYSNAYNPLSTYCGNDVLGDVQNIIADFLPDLIVIPHPNDDHSDHRAAGNFTRMGVSLVQDKIPYFNPQILGYLIHYGQFPQPRGYHLHQPLLPPLPLSGEQNSWFRYDLSFEEVQAKLAAIHKYPTQMRLLGKYLASFARKNELFVSISAASLAPIEYTSLPLREEGVKETPLLFEPASVNTQNMIVAGADLIGWKVVRLGNQLVLSVETRGNRIPSLNYRIFVKTPDGQTLTFTQTSPESILTQRTFSVRLDLAELENPSVIAFSGEVTQQVTLDRTGWHFLELKDWIP